MMNWGEIKNILKDEVISEQGNSVEKITHIVTDSRLIQHPVDSCFFCIKGNQHDGHNFIQPLAEKGVRFFIGELPEALAYKSINYLQVRSTIRALQKIAKAHREKFLIPVIGITGSNGKTTTKEWLSQILGKKFHVVKSPKSYNSQIGVPHSLWQINENHEIAVFETGISKKGEMQSLAEMVQPALGIFTNIGPAHDEGFSDKEEKIREKSLLFHSCRKIIYCRDYQNIDKVLLSSYPKGRLISWSKNDPEADYYFMPFRDGYSLMFNGEKYYFQLPFTFDVWLENAFHVIITSLIVGCTYKQIQEGLNELKPIPMRLQVKEGINQSFIIDDTYNNDLQGLSVALDFLRQQQQKDKKTVILSDLLQTGLHAEDLYARINDLLKRHDISRIITIGPQLSSFQNHFETPSTHFANTAEFLENPPAFRDEMILVKGARHFELEKIVSYLDTKNHRTVLEVNFEAIINNLNRYWSKIGTETKLMVMVKAFAYGGGSLEIANLLQFHKVDYLGVAYTDEAVSLRKNGITLPIMVMSPEFGEAELLSDYNLEPEVYNLHGLKSLLILENPPAIHLKIETGMNRLGFTEDQISELIKILVDHKGKLRVSGLFTHFSSADDPAEDDFTEQQGKTFQSIAEKIVDALGYRPLLHAVNSAGIIRWKKFHFDMVRLGIGLYGYDSSETISLSPISTLKTTISQIKQVKKGGSIGYGRAGKAEKDLTLAVVPIGYADGYLRIFGQGNGKMQIRGQLTPTIGNVCMDMTMLDVTGLEVSEGDEVVVFGNNPTIQHLADWAGTIPYEILTNISQRVKRVYLSE